MFLLPRTPFAFLPFLFCYLLSTAVVEVEGEGQTIVYGRELTTYFELKEDSSPDRWLNGAWGNGNVRVYTDDVRSDSNRQGGERFRFSWRVFSALGDGNRDRSDPKDGECVKYGDEVYIQVVGKNYAVLGTESSSNDELVHGPLDYKWIVRSNPGNGDHNTGNDPAVGLCLKELESIYIQSRSKQNRWIKGRESLSALLSNFNQETDENEKEKYRWILRTDLEFKNSIDCPVREVLQGYWKPLRFIAIEETETYTVTSTRTEELSVTETDEWSVSVEATISQGWSLFGQAGGISVTAGASYASSFSTTATSILTQTESITKEKTFPVGQLWQFVLEMRDLCDPDWEIAFDAVASTENANEPPCCLPGFFLDNENLHGPCIDESPCACTDEICQASTSGGGGGGGDGDGGGPGCLSSENTVDVLGKGTVRMDELQIGDYILSDHNRYSRVYSFLHKDLNVETTFLQIHLENSKELLEVTADHLVFMHGTGGAVRAGDIQLGDDIGKKVIKIKEVVRQGLYAPATESGSFVVNVSTIASNYIGVLGKKVVENPWVDEHRLAHALFVIQRIGCKFLPSYCGTDEEYTKEGYSFWAAHVLYMMEHFNSLNDSLQIALLLIAIPLLTFVYLVEQLCIAMSPIGMIAAVSAAVVVCARGQTCSAK